MALRSKLRLFSKNHEFYKIPFKSVQISSRWLFCSASKSQLETSTKERKISQAMRAYLAQAKEHNEFMASELAEFEVGKRHLSNIMGVDVNNMSEKDIDRAIEYLLPSGLHDKKARPLMKHPNQVIPLQKSVAFDESGRPFHHLFYSITYNYYQCLHDIAEAYSELNDYEDKIATYKKGAGKVKPLILSASEWISKEVMEEKIKDKISDDKYHHALKILDRLSVHSCASKKSDMIMNFRKPLVSEISTVAVPVLQTDESGRNYSESFGERKNSRATVKVISGGIGNVSVNGLSLLDSFPYIADRQQIMFPLTLSGLLGKIDIEASVVNGGFSGQAGAIRLALARSIQSFVDHDTCNKMRLAGLLTQDPRRRERMKPGQKGARAKFTWKKR